MCQEHQDDIYKLMDWEQKWAMLFHPDKCNILQVTMSKNPLQLNYSFKGKDNGMQPIAAIMIQETRSVTYFKTLSGHSKTDKTKVFKTNGS